MRNPFKRPIWLRIFLRTGQSFDVQVEKYSLTVNGDALGQWEFTWRNKHNRIVTCDPGNIVAVVKL